MSCYCLTPMDSPAFFYGAGDCETVNHNLRVVSGDLAGADDIVSAILIQLGSDQLHDSERGFWGDEFQSAPIGNKLWTLAGYTGQDVSAKVDEYIRDALRPLIRAGWIDRIEVATVRTISGSEISLTVYRGDGELRVSLNG